MTDNTDRWTEADSELYKALAAVAVPARAEQLATLLALLPFRPDEPFQAVEIGCGPGVLAQALLDCFPQAGLAGLDGSPAMRAAAAEKLKRFGSRCALLPFDLEATDWLSHLEGADCVLSSLCLHHLSGPAKQVLFSAVSRRLSPRGVFLIADLVQPQRSEANRLFAAAWDRLARAQSLAHTGSAELFERFVETEWNLYHFPDPMDRPSPLFDQLTWLEQAGFATVDCFWLQAGHAIYGGYKSSPRQDEGGLSFIRALQAAETAIRDV